MEADILYTAVFENEQTRLYHPEKLLQYPNVLENLSPAFADLSSVVRLCDVRGTNAAVYNDLRRDRLIITLNG